MLKGITHTSIIMGITFFLSMCATLILGNTMSVEEFGQFALLKTFILLGATFSLIGIDQLIIRRGKNDSIALKYMFNYWIIISFSSIICSAVFSFIFSLKISQFIYLWIILFSQANLIYYAAYYRINHQFSISQLVYNFWKILLFLISIYVLSINIVKLDIYKFLAIILFISFLIFSVILLFSSKNKNQVQSFTQLKKYILQGIAFWIVNVVSLLFSGLDRILISSVLDTEILGEYHAITFICITGFSMLGSAIGFVLFPMLANKADVKLSKILSFYVIGGVALFSIFIVMGKDIFTLAYNGQYNYLIEDKLLYVILGVGFIQGIHTIVHFILYSQADSRSLYTYFKFTFSLCIVYVLLFLGINILVELDLFLITNLVIMMWFLKLMILIYLINIKFKIKLNM